MEENNILIAEFMGAEVEIWKAHERLGDNTSEDAWYAYFDGNGVAVEELAYDTSWDWLMPVVEKIETISGKLPTHVGNIPNDEDWESNNFLSTNIEETYKAVVEFIKTKK